MSIISYIKSFPVKSMPVRKELVRSGWCPECGKSLGRTMCSNAECMFDASALIERCELEKASTDE